MKCLLTTSKYAVSDNASLPLPMTVREPSVVTLLILQLPSVSTFTVPHDVFWPYRIFSTPVSSIRTEQHQADLVYGASLGPAALGLGI
jgi:hypothetical protein